MAANWPPHVPAHINQAARDGDYDTVRAWYSEHSLETSDERDREVRGRFGRALLRNIIFNGYKDGRTPDGREWVDTARWFVAQGVDINWSDIYLNY